MLARLPCGRRPPRLLSLAVSAVPELSRDPLRDQVQTTRGASYTLARELGGGGMRRVYVAREEAPGRDVVVTVLAPKLAEGLSAQIRVHMAIPVRQRLAVTDASCGAPRTPHYPAGSLCYGDLFRPARALDG